MPSPELLPQQAATCIPIIDKKSTNYFKLKPEYVFSYVDTRHQTMDQISQWQNDTR